MYGQRPFPQPIPYHAPSIPWVRTHGEPQTPKSRTRPATMRLGLMRPPSVIAPSRPSPLRNVPNEIALEIVELALRYQSQKNPTALALVSRRFNDLVCKLIYRNVTLDSLARIARFNRAVHLKSTEFLATHVDALAVTTQEHYTNEARVQLEEIVAACTGLRTLAIPRPGVLASNLISVTRPTELIIQKFDAMTPFEWDPPFAVTVVESPASHVSQNLKRLRICEPGQAWHSPLATLEFFGALEGLTHLALTRHVRSGWHIPSPTNDNIFASEIQMLLQTRPKLRMLVVSLYPVSWPKLVPLGTTLCSVECLCKALGRLAQQDNRLVLLATGWETVTSDDNMTLHPAQNHGGDRLGNVCFWDSWKMSDKRVVSFATCWEPEILPNGVKWTYGAELLEGHDFWGNWVGMPD
ncbi:hypothetical protein R3P38DRAFT_3304039 [Favolaschia claudopus]|uniref:F-box domain-containing protein n=1 Tax=Favolaschia claudopus TaxID=2862362 RepID=A0AAW0E274_9AGAR